MVAWSTTCDMASAKALQHTELLGSPHLDPYAPSVTPTHLVAPDQALQLSLLPLQGLCLHRPQPLAQGLL